MIKEVLLVHHTHTDIGFTHPQPVIFELHDRFIDRALDIADATAEERDDAKFRWTCEVTGTTRGWWDRATNADRDRFLAAVARGQFEVAAMEWHLTPLADLRMLIRSMENVHFFRSLGIPVRSAMNTDVNGVPWGLVDVLLDHGIDGFSMAINSHLGGPPSPRPGAFRWASPSGREIIAWNGFQYWQAANLRMKIPLSLEETAASMIPFLAETEERGYPLSFIAAQITDTSHPDNAGPEPKLSSFVREWNDTNPTVRLRTALLSEVFDRLRQEDLPLVAGDWTDYWNLGAGSSVRETTVLMQGLRNLDGAFETLAWPGVAEPRQETHLDAAHANLALYAEHTWGADCSISRPESIETRMQWSMKSAYAFQGLASSRIPLRDGLHHLAKRAGGEASTFLFYNPLPVPVRVPLRLPIEELDWALNPRLPHVHRLDSALANLPERVKHWFEIEIPALGYRTYAVDALPKSTSDGLSITESGIQSSRVALEFLPEGGVGSFTVDGVEYAGTSSEYTFGVPILERPASGSRRDIMKLDFDCFEPADGWVKDWERTLSRGEFLERTTHEEPGVVETVQSFQMENGDRVDVQYRLFTNAPSVDVEVRLTSAGDVRPYSLALPFTLPQAGSNLWHFDTAGAVVEFDREQLPTTSRHYITARRFVRMQTESAALSIASPDLPHWKFGTMRVASTNHLDPAERKSTMLAWLSNNYWEVNFLANQVGLSTFRMQLIPHQPEPIEASYARALPAMVFPHVHAYRELGPVLCDQESLMSIEGEGVILESITPTDGDTIVVLSNLTSDNAVVTLRPGVLVWSAASYATVGGERLTAIASSGPEGWNLTIPPRGTIGVRLDA